MESERRVILRHGALFLLLSGIVGLIVAAPAPHAEKWRTLHLTGLVTALLLFGFGSLWRDLDLTPPLRRLAFVTGLVAAWMGFAQNAFIALVNFPSVVSEPGRAPDAPWQTAVFFTGLAIVVPATFLAFGLVWHGLRGRSAPAAP